MPRIRNLIAIVTVAIASAWWLSRPNPIDANEFKDLHGNIERGKDVFKSAACASCHDSHDPKSETQPYLAGGKPLTTTIGTFYAPNISQDLEYGIGDWQLEDLANALLQGLSPDRRHYYPSVLCTQAVRLAPQDIADLYSYLQLLPADPTPAKEHDLTFPFDNNRLIGLWKAIYSPL